MILNDGTVVPNFLSTRSDPGPSGYELSQNDYQIRSGRVIAAHAPSSETNTNKKFWEYDVKVDQISGGTHTEIVYPRAQLANTFGGVADFVRWKPRVLGESAALGTRVFVMCLNGNTRGAIIIGGENHPASPADPEGDDADYVVFQNNGIHIAINPDGDLTITHKGATKSDGSVIDDDPTKNGTSIVLNKDGDIILGTGAESKNLIHMDSQNKTIRIESTEDLVEVIAKGNVEVTSEAKVIITASSNVEILSSGVMTGAATDATMMGDTYRRSEQTLHSTITPLFQTLGIQMGVAGAGLAAAAAVHVIPVVGPIIGAPGIVTASTALITSATLLSQIFAALQAFEAQAATYLSTKNKSD